MKMASRFNMLVAQRKRLPMILARRRRRQETIDRTKYPAQKPTTNAAMATAAAISIMSKSAIHPLERAIHLGVPAAKASAAPHSNLVATGRCGPRNEIPVISITAIAL
jgi:hypothetical protein